jgi:hypothetical protein
MTRNSSWMTQPGRAGVRTARENATPEPDQYVSTHCVGILMGLAPHKLEDT